MMGRWRRGRYDWHKLAYPAGRARRRRTGFRRFLPNAREVRHATGCALVLVAAWWLWELADIGSTLFTSPANWDLWKRGQSASAASSDTLAGRASVIDGDTIEIHGERIRLLDIDTPESKQLCQDQDGLDYRCGQKAALALSDWIGARTVTCETTKLDRYKRHLARCIVAGEDIATWLAENGLGVPYRECKCEAIRDAADRAKAGGRGIWAGEFELPWEWRKSH